MIRSCLPRWKFTDSCGHPQVPGAMHLGCAHAGHTAHYHATRRDLLKTGVAIAGAAGLATILDPREVFSQVRVFPPPPPAVSPILGLMDTHVHSAPMSSAARWTTRRWRRSTSHAGSRGSCSRTT